MAIHVSPKTLPVAGTDVVDITIEETYDIEGIGADTVLLRGTLVAERTVPLLEHGRDRADWETATVVARFTKLDLYGKSDIFGPVLVRLDESAPAFGLVRNGKCSAAIGIQVVMPEHGLVLKSEEPVQLHSVVTTVPPIGDEKTESVKPVRLIDVRSEKSVGTLAKARVSWRELTKQTAFLTKDIRAQVAPSEAVSTVLGARLERVMSQLGDLLQEVDSLKEALGRR